MGLEPVEWINQAQDRDKLAALADVEIKFRVQ